MMYNALSGLVRGGKPSLRAASAKLAAARAIGTMQQQQQQQLQRQPQEVPPHQQDMQQHLQHQQQMQYQQQQQNWWPSPVPNQGETRV